MSKKAMWMAIVVLVLLWAVAALLVRAEVAVRPTQGGILAAAERLLEPTIPVEPTSTATLEPTETATLEPTPTATPGVASVQVSLTGGPTVLCAGYNLYYTFRLTNTSSVEPLLNLVITDIVPLGTWYAVGGLGGTIPGEFNSEINALIWHTGVISPGQMVEAKLTLRSYSGQRNGTVISNTFTYAATSLREPDGATLISVVDIRACPKTDTPTPTRTVTKTPTATRTVIQKATETPTPSPTKWRYFLPLIHKRAAGRR